MQKIALLLLACINIYTAKAQNTFSIVITDSKTALPIAGVSIQIEGGGAGNTTNNAGRATLKNIPNGKQQITISHINYKTEMLHLIFPLRDSAAIIIALEPAGEMEEVIVQSTRTSRTISNTPSRIETIDGEELDEKNNMRPANVSMLLHESTGLQVQQTSATSGNASIRVQGLDGRYTQLLKDGYPNFGNFASGLSVLEIPPLDLQQVEVIKGPASTLYGGGAIAGVINFISKTPKEKFEGDVLFNQSHIGQTNMGTYLSQKKKKWGYSFLGLLNFQKAYDVDKDQFSEIPKSNNFTINPKLFFYPSASLTIVVGNSLTKGVNTGGDMAVIKGSPDANHVYFEKNRTTRNTSTVEVAKKLTGNNRLKLKQSLAVFDRHITIPNYSFSGISTNSFTDLSLLVFKKQHTIISGVNMVLDKFKQEETNIQNTNSFTTGAYLQDTWDITDRIKMESGVRIDHVRYRNSNYKKTQAFVLPRISALFKISNKVSSRIGGGLGYKIPTIFTEQTETMQYQDVLALENVKAEQSIGGTADVNYKTASSGNWVFSANQMFFYTRINTPLVLQINTAGKYYFSNALQPVISKGFETNLKFIYKENLKLFVGYTFTHATANYLTTQKFLPLLPKSKLNITLMYEKENNFKLGLESYFTGSQYLYYGSSTPSFAEFGFMAQKTISKISLFVNFENFTDERQSKYKRVVNPPYNNPGFDEIWNHTEGFVINGGIKIKL